MTSNTATIRDCMDSMLDILLFIDKICKKNGLEYWLDGGTLLGAKRNGKYIPWDDDVDICLLYSDYEKLNEILGKTCENHKFYISFNSHRPPTNWTNNLGDIRILKDGVIPVKIDIIPIKAIPNESKAIQIDKSIVSFARFFKKGSYNNENELLDIHDKFVPQKNAELLLKKDKFYSFFLLEYLPKCSSKNKEYLYNYAFNDAMVQREREYYKHSTIFPLSSIQFEGHNFPAPGNVNQYLTILYGENYMIPPDESNRIPYAYNNYFSTLKKEKTISRLALHLNREYTNVLPRSASIKPLRYFWKFTSFTKVIMKSILKGDFRFIAIYLKFAMRHQLN